jgi:sterol desaturase/sphingolipid hydroxylase (fatty acid hydroxylase superfamily)
MHSNLQKKWDIALRYGLYPLLAGITLAYIVYALKEPRQTLGHHNGAYFGGILLFMIVIEALRPLRSNWRMTKTSFWRRDLPFLLLGGSCIGAVNYLAVTIATQYNLAGGTFFEAIPVLPGTIIALLATDFLWYWVHRISHEARGKTGRFLWKIHAAHHLPNQVYVLMHATSHPVNTIIIRAIVTLPLFFLGFPPEVAFICSVITSFQTIVSHFNVDSRVGWLNYVLIGTELHRYHHSADASEARNFGAVLSIWDQIFGTFHYRPGKVPASLGPDERSLYPPDVKVLDVVAFPFRRHT